MSIRLTAPKGMFRLVGLETFESKLVHYLIGDFEKLVDAIQRMQSFGHPADSLHIYNDQGVRVTSFWPEPPPYGKKGSLK